MTQRKEGFRKYEASNHSGGRHHHRCRGTGSGERALKKKKKIGNNISRSPPSSNPSPTTIDGAMEIVAAGSHRRITTLQSTSTSRLIFMDMNTNTNTRIRWRMAMVMVMGRRLAVDCYYTPRTMVCNEVQKSILLSKNVTVRHSPLIWE